MYYRKLINSHSHLLQDTDVPLKVKDYEANGCLRFLTAAMPKAWKSHYLGNADTLKWIKEFPGVIMGLAAMELGLEISHPDEIDKLKEQGFIGLKFIAPLRPYDHDLFLPLYERAEKLEMPILFHTGWLAAGENDHKNPVHWVSANDMRPYRLDKLARMFPSLKMIGAHLGNPHCDEALNLSRNYKNIYFDICGGSGGNTHKSLLKKALMPFTGADMSNPEENLAIKHFRKFVFATDNATIPVWYSASEEIMDYLQIPEDVRELFYYKNTCEIFNWDI